MCQWGTASSRWSQRLVSRTGVCTVYTFLQIQVVSQTVSRTQIWRDKVQCILLKELDCFTSIEWSQNASFPSQLFKSKWKWRDKEGRTCMSFFKMCCCYLPIKSIKISLCLPKLEFAKVVAFFWDTYSLTAALDQLRVVASSTSNDPGPRSRQHQQIGQCPVSSGRSAGVGFYWQLQCLRSRCVLR